MYSVRILMKWGESILFGKKVFVSSPYLLFILLNIEIIFPYLLHGQLARWRKWRAFDVGEAKEGLDNELWRKWSNGRVGEWAVT